MNTPKETSVCIVVYVIALLGATASGNAISQAPAACEPVSVPIIFTQIPVEKERKAGSRLFRCLTDLPLPAGSRVAILDPSAQSAGATTLSTGFVSAGRPDISFDGKRILFVGKQTETEPFNVWEMRPDGSGLRKITRREQDCIAAIYLSTIYTLGAEAPVRQIAFSAIAEDGTLALYTCHMDGSRVRRITFNPYGATDPYLLRDGRLLYSSGNAPEQGGGSALFTVNTDGTDVFVFAETHERTATRGTPCETDNGHVVYVESTEEVCGTGVSPVGARLGGGNALVSAPRTRSTHSRSVVAADPTGVYRSPSALDGDRLLVSYQVSGGKSYGIYSFNLRSGARTTEWFDAPRWHDVDAIALKSRPVPEGRSSVVDERVGFGFLYCLDAYLSDTRRSGKIGRGDIDRVRIIKAQPESGGGTAPRTRLLKETTIGEAVVEPDGSFYLALPARTPLRLETLGNDGDVLDAMQSWIWLMPKEGRGCIGCHENRELTPPNRFVLAIQKEPQEIGVKLPRPQRSPTTRPRTGYGGSPKR